MIFLSKILKAPVLDNSNEELGRLIDITVASQEKPYPSVTGIVVKTREGEVVIAWDQVENLSRTENTLKVSKNTLVPFVPPAGTLYLSKDVLDQQIVDTKGARVVRVNDLQLGKVADHFVVLGIDISSWALIRRLGVNLKRVPFFRQSRIGYIDWQNVNLVGGRGGEVKLKAILPQIHKIHPADVANIIEKLNVQEGSAIVKLLSDEMAAKVLEEVDPKLKHVLIDLIGAQRAARIIGEMPSDEIADLVKKLPQQASVELLASLEDHERKAITRLTNYQEGTAGALMTASFITVLPDRTIHEAREHIHKVSEEFRSIYYLYVADAERHLMGVLSMRTLLVSKPEAKIADMMTTTMVTVRGETELDEVARTMTKYNLFSIAVVDSDRRVLGIVSVDDVMRYLIPEA